MKKSKRVSMVRQGDVLLIAIATAAQLPKLTPAKRDRGRVVLAYGETTGHAHAIEEANVALLVADDAAAMGEAARELLASVGLTTELRDEEVVGLLSVDEPAVLRHEEHQHIPLEGGTQYVVLRQREYAPEALRTVAD